MLYLYYTGAKSYLQQQSEITKSLGGFISNTLIPKDILNNLFSDITNFSLKKNKTETKCIAIKNNSQAIINNINISAIFDVDNICEYEFAFIQPTQDACGNYMFELLTDSEQLPYYAIFTDLSTSQVIPSINANEYLGLFIKRKIKQSVIENPCLSIEQLLNSTKEEFLQLNFSW